ncbi:MAG: hypothetical protein WD069_18785 [Planctomycetales bacterium]
MRRSTAIAPAVRAVLIALLAGSAGCRLGQPQITHSPLTWSEQKAAIFELAPAGTPRAAAIARLEGAGIAGDWGARDTIYYCNLWERPDGARWQMDVALLFDADGRLYDLRPAEAEIRAAPAAPSPGNGSEARAGETAARSRGESLPGEPELRTRPLGPR